MSIRIFAICLVALPLVSLASRPVHAQVNAETLRPRAVTEGVSGALDLTFGLAKGNVDFVDFGAQGRIQYETLRPLAEGETLRFTDQRLFLVANARYGEQTALGETESKPFITQMFAHARWTSMWRRHVGTELFFQLQRNDFLRLQVRSLWGTGFRFELVHEKDIQVWGGTGTMLEYQRIDVAEGASDAPVELLHRSTSYVGARTELREKKVVLQAIGYVQPAWKRPEDIRILVEVEGLIKLGEKLSLGEVGSFFYDSEPPTSVRRADLRLTTTLKLSF